MKSVSVIVPTFRDGDVLTTCIEALRRQTYPAELIQILVIDNTTQFELRGRATEYSPAIILHEPRSGSYAARNCGLADATGDIVAFTDADCIPSPQWIEQGVRELERFSNGALIAGRIDVFAQNPRRPTAVELFECVYAFPQKKYVEYQHFGATANVFVSKNIIELVGGFLDSLQSGGDSEFGRRVSAAGFPVVYSDLARVRHPARRLLRSLLNKARRVVRGAYDMERAGRLPKGTMAQGILSDLRPPIRACWDLVNNKSLGNIVRRCAVGGVMVIWQYYRAAYRLRLLIGKK